MTMIERVARALAQADGFHADAKSNDSDEVPAWHLYREMARAAIQAMREPTKAMRHASDFETAEIKYPAMIDAALSETSEDKA